MPGLLVVKSQALYLYRVVGGGVVCVDPCNLPTARGLYQQLLLDWYLLSVVKFEPGYEKAFPGFQVFGGMHF